MPLRKHRFTAEDYWSQPEGVRAELIDGELWDLAAPSRVHQEIVLKTSRRLDAHIEEHGGSCKVYPAPFAVNLFANDSTFVEPDISVVCDSSKLSDRGCEGAPDLVVEVVSPSSTGMDYISKPALYKEAGVRECWVCDPLKRRTFVFDFAEDGDAAPMVCPFSEEVESTVLPGFRICFGAIVDSM